MASPEQDWAADVCNKLLKGNNSSVMFLFNKTHLKVFIIACYTSGGWATLYSGIISASLYCKRCIQSTFFPLGLSLPPREPTSMQQSGRKQEKINYPFERVHSRAWRKLDLLAVWIILPAISKRLRLNDLNKLSLLLWDAGLQEQWSIARRAGGEEQLLSLWLELTGGRQTVLPVRLELILLFVWQLSSTSVLGEVHMVTPSMRVIIHFTWASPQPKQS